MRYLPPWRHQDGSSKHRAPVSPEQCSHLAALGPFPAGCGDLDPLDGACAVWSATGLPHSPSGSPSPWASGSAVAPGSHHHGAVDASSPAAWSPGGRGNGQPGPLLGPVAAPSTRGPPRARQRPESGAAPGLFCDEDRRLGEGRAGHVPRVTQPLNGRAERQTGSPELLAAASTSASPKALHPRAQPPFSAPIKGSSGPAHLPCRPRL